MLDLIIFSEATAPKDIIIRDPLPLCLISYDWKYLLYFAAPSSTPISGDAGPDQSIYNDLIAIGYGYFFHNHLLLPPDTPISGDAGAIQSAYLDLILINQTFSYKIDLSLLLDLGMDILFASVNESSVISLGNTVGKEGGSLQFLGRQPDLLMLTFTSYHHLLETFKDQLTFNIRLVRYGLTWWEGEAYVLDIASLGDVEDSKTGLIQVTIGLQGIKKAISGPAIGLMGYAGDPQDISDDLIIIGSTWDYSLTVSGEFDQS